MTPGAVVARQANVAYQQMAVIGPSETERTLGEEFPDPDWSSDARIDWQTRLAQAEG